MLVPVQRMCNKKHAYACCSWSPIEERMNIYIYNVGMCVCFGKQLICPYSFSSLNKLLDATTCLTLALLWAAMMDERGPLA